MEQEYKWKTSELDIHFSFLRKLIKFKLLQNHYLHGCQLVPSILHNYVVTSLYEWSYGLL
jgi:hypothetical protein